MALDIKICGLRTVEAITRAAARGATHLGFIHFAKSPRHLSVDEMATLRPAVPAGVKLVVVSVDADDALLAEITDRVRPDLLQLHGRETPERVSAVRRLSGLPAIKALSIAAAADLDRLSAYRGVADGILLDAKRPAGSELPGGNGVAFDWNLLRALPASQPYMLSGGLHAGNVGEALARLSPAGLDVSSGVESAPGVKDMARMNAFFDAVEAFRAEGAAIFERKAS
jgi:phosphoribosylanthranilate isomerase